MPVPSQNLAPYAQASVLIAVVFFAARTLSAPQPFLWWLWFGGTVNTVAFIMSSLLFLGCVLASVLAYQHCVAKRPHMSEQCVNWFWVALAVPFAIGASVGLKFSLLQGWERVASADVLTFWSMIWAMILGPLFLIVSAGLHSWSDPDD